VDKTVFSSEQPRQATLSPLTAAAPSQELPFGLPQDWGSILRISAALLAKHFSVRQTRLFLSLGGRMEAKVRTDTHKRRTHKMRQLKTPIIGVLAASIMVLSNPPPANATSISDFRTELQKGVKSPDYKNFSWNQFEYGIGFSNLFPLHKSAVQEGLNVWSSKGWHGFSAVSSGASKEKVVATPEPSSLLELTTVSLVSTGLWFWRRKNGALKASALSTV
jgi:hypothetical protein